MTDHKYIRNIDGTVIVIYVPLDKDLEKHLTDKINDFYRWGYIIPETLDARTTYVYDPINTTGAPSDMKLVFYAPTSGGTTQSRNARTNSVSAYVACLYAIAADRALR